MLTTISVAIPVVTRCIADFLGFGHQVKDLGNSQAKYSENEIYQHITNCQMFLAYNADETKLLKRRNAFKDSMEFLLNLAKEGNILEASRWGISKSLKSLFNQKPTSTRDQEIGQMKALGLEAADRILKQEKDSGKAAAILLLAALDVAYIGVLAVCRSNLKIKRLLMHCSLLLSLITFCREHTISQSLQVQTLRIGSRSRNWP